MGYCGVVVSVWDSYLGYCGVVVGVWDSDVGYYNVVVGVWDYCVVTECSGWCLGLLCGLLLCSG